MIRGLKLLTSLIIWTLLTVTSVYASPSPVTITVNDAEYDLANTGFSIDIDVDDPQYILGAAFTVRYDTEHLTMTSVESTFFDTFAEQFEAADAYNDPPESVTVDNVTYNSPLVIGEESASIGGARIAGVRARSAGTNNTTLCTIYFTATGLEYSDTVSVTVEPSMIDNENAGYDASGEQTAMLVTQLSETSFEEIEVSAIVQGTVTITDTSEALISGALSFDGQAIGNTQITIYSPLTGRTTTATTDDQGNFEVTLSNSEASAELQISFSHADYGSYTTSVNVAEGGITANFVNDAPEKPVMAAVTGATVLTPILETEAFYDASNGHGETEWQIVDLSALTDSGMELDDLIDTDGSVIDETFIVYWADSFTNLTTLIVPDFYLQPDTSYAVRAMFYDDCPAGAMSSEWSDFTRFKTQALPEGFAVTNGVLVPEDQSLTEEELAAFEADVIGIRSAGESLNLGIVQPDNAEIRQISSLHLDDMDDTAVSAMPEGLETPYGLVGFNMALDDDDSGDGTVRVTIHFDDAVSEDMTWWKYDALQQSWIDYTDYSEFSSDRRSIELTLKDGDYGDEDGIENGRIVDPGGLGTNISGANKNASGGDSCFIETLSGGMKSANLPWALIALFLSVLGMAICLRRKWMKNIMNKKTAGLFLLPLMIISIILLSGVNASAYTGESDLGDTIRALKILTGQASSDEILASEHIDGDRKIGLGEAIYWMQDAAGIPFVDLQAQDYEEDFLLSTLALDVTVGDRQVIVILDTPRVGLDDQAYNREDLIFTCIKGDQVALVEKEDPTDSAEDTLYYIRGLSEGVAVFQISYPDYTGQKPLLAVNVKAANAAGPAIETDITLTKYDIIYFTGESIDFTFSVTADEGATLIAELNGTVYTPTDNSFTVPLINGYNPIVITSAGSSGATTEVVNIRAKKCAISVVNNTRAGSGLFYEGDIVTVNFTGLTTPVPKVSRIYNPSANRITYDTLMPRYSIITGGTAQYSLSNVEVELTAAGDYVLTNGHIDTNWFGDALYSERSVGTAPPNTAAPQTDKSFCILPDIHITVLENQDYDPQLFTVNIANTEDIWPGDQVVLNLPDLDIQTIAEAHPEDDDSWMTSSLLNSYTIFVTDIPGQETVTSASAVVDYELEKIQSVRFMVPEDTPPGTYHVRGGYVWVMYGPTWWKKVTYYHKGNIPDITIEVKEKVPGQLHGVVPIQSDTLKSRLAEALGKGADYTGDLTSAELKTLTGELDLSNSGLTDADMSLMQYLTGVTAIDLSGNPDITSATVKKSTFDWTLEKTLDFSGCAGLTELANRAFFECTNLKGFIFPDTLTRIGESCFTGCTGLAPIILPVNLETIGDWAFAGCTAMIRITISDGVTALNEGIFHACENLQDIQLPANLKTIGPDCFSRCSSLTEIILPVSLTSIGDNCFNRCTNLRDLTLPDSLTAIGDYAFSHCHAMQIINIPASLETVGSGTFGSSYSSSGTHYFKVVDGRQSQLTRSELGLYEKIVFLIGDDAQVNPPTAEVKAGQGTVTLTHQIPDSETVVWGSSNANIAVVEDGVVSGVSGGIAYIYVKSESDSHSGYCRVTVTDNGLATLSSLELSGIDLNHNFDSLAYIYTADIAGDIRTTSVTLDATDSGSILTLNNETVTAGSTTEVDLTYPETVLTITVTSGGITKTYTITIDMAAVTEKEDGQVAIGNPAIKDRLAVAAGKDAGIYTENLTVTELAAITGTIDLSATDLNNWDMAVMKYLTGVSAIDLSDNTALTWSLSPAPFDWTTPKSLDFSGCTGIERFVNDGFREIENLTGIVLPETMTRIDTYSFMGCTRLSSVVLPLSLKYIGTSAFKDCTSLIQIDLPDGLETLESGSFSVSGLKSIILPSSLTSIGSGSFEECGQLHDLTIPAGVTEIGYGCFKDSALGLLDLRQTAFTAADTADWLIPDIALVVYPGAQSAGLDTTTAELNIGEADLTLSHAIPDGLAVVWSSTNPDVAEVSADGVVTGVSAGTALILVSSEDGTYFDYCRVTFTETESPGLAALSLTGATPDQAFDPLRVYYTAGGDYFTPLQITATPADAASTLSVNGSAVAAGTPSDPVDLSAGENIFKVAVTTGSSIRTYTIVVTLEAVYEGETSVSIANTAFMQRLAVAAGKGSDYNGPLTYDELGAIQFDLDLSNLDLTDADMAVMKYLRSVSTIDLSGNTALTPASATGAVFDWTMLSSLDFSGCTGITEILDNAFEVYEYLSGIALPETVTHLGESCFAGTGLVSVTLPGTISSMGTEIFKDCIALTQADLSQVPVTVLADGRELFEGCTAITDMADIVLPEGITALPMGFFSGCTGITAINLPSSITALGDSVFASTGITEADLSGMTQLGQGVVRYCANLRQVVLPEGITNLDGSFAGCTSLTTVDLPDSLTTIGGWTFRESGITHLVVPAGVTSIGLFCFQDSNALAILDLSATSLSSMSIRMARVPSTTTVLFMADDAGLSATELTMAAEETTTLTHAIPGDKTVTWLSSNTAVATVSGEGVVTAVAPGIALIAVQADDGTYNGTCEVTVTAVP